MGSFGYAGQAEEALYTVVVQPPPELVEHISTPDSAILFFAE